MTPYIVAGLVLLVLVVVFVYSALRMARDPGPPAPIDPETRAQLYRLQARGEEKSVPRSVWEGDDVA